ncbi:MAG: hypothetical protein P8J00_13885 [Yoonia sp.]|nr:hypothetical protein [Yoonia sp.]
MLRLFCLITVLGLAAAYDSTGTNTNPFDDTSTDTTNTGGDTTDTGDAGDVGGDDGSASVKTAAISDLFLIALANFAGAQSIEVGPKDALVIGIAMVRDGNVQGAIAIAHTRLENFTRAQLWLRRAAQYAPDDATKAVVAKDFRTVRERNPWSSSLRFGIFPRSNINNGSTAEIYYLPGLDFPLTLQPSSRALSRFEISGGFSSQYRLHLDDVSATFLTATINPSDLISDPRSKQL